MKRINKNVLLLRDIYNACSKLLVSIEQQMDCKKSAVIMKDIKKLEKAIKRYRKFVKGKNKQNKILALSDK